MRYIAARPSLKKVRLQLTFIQTEGHIPEIDLADQVLVVASNCKSNMSENASPKIQVQGDLQRLLGH